MVDPGPRSHAQRREPVADTISGSSCDLEPTPRGVICTPCTTESASGTSFAPPNNQTRRPCVVVHTLCIDERDILSKKPGDPWLAVIAGLNREIAELETVLAKSCNQHPDADLYLSLPGLGVTLSARVLGEFGDDPERYATAKSRRNYAGTSPLTIASGIRAAVVSRHVRNRQLYNAIDQWAFSSLRASPGCRDFYDHRRTQGDLHHQALRALGNRLVGYLHGCLHTRICYNERTAWAHRQTQQTQIAARHLQPWDVSSRPMRGKRDV